MEIGAGPGRVNTRDAGKFRALTRAGGAGSLPGMSEGFVIAPLPLHAGTLALCPLPRDAADRAAVAAFAPDLVLTMTEVPEMAALGAADLPAWLATQGIGWVHFPVVDFGTPPDGAGWEALALRAQAVLAQGGRVLAHCRGGLGRSGMVALRLMVAAGEAPEAALARLRAVRPGAVETPAQFDWATRG